VTSDKVVPDQLVGSRGDVVEGGQDFYWLVAIKDARDFIGGGWHMVNVWHGNGEENE
jgi:hypothetical protein